MNILKNEKNLNSTMATVKMLENRLNDKKKEVEELEKLIQKYKNASRLIK